ncbi:ABC transporter permease [Silvibacterium acidisoli]|uniref:ABC transporter permease n=1 Tax=Acidobacteriaceae bacterium ZG23-2 TaxID=2883246 RepID=UPI00406C85EC
MEDFVQDLRFALRQLRKAPGFAGSVILTIALGIGVTAAIFSVLYAMLIRPLPYSHPEEIFSVETLQHQGYRQWAAYPEYKDWRRLTHGFSALAGFNPWGTVNFEGSSGPVALQSVQGTDNFFDVFGVQPILGRTFTPGEDLPGRNDVVVLSYEVWRDTFSSDRNVIGRKASIDGHPYTIIGVMPAGFRFPIGKVNAVYTPIHVSQRLAEDRGDHWLQTIARLKPGVTPQQAAAGLTSVMTNLGRTDQFNAGRSVHMIDLESYVVGSTKNSLYLLLCAVMALLAIGCVNVAGLLLARGVKREREVALRSAIGARRSRIVKQMFTEALLFAFLGGLAGVALAYGLLGAIRLLLVSALARGAEVELNAPVLLGSLLVAAVVTIAAALAPALRLSSIAPTLALRAGGAAGTTRNQHRVRAAFVMTQIALALTLLVVSGLLLRILGGLKNADLGFSPDRILTTEVNLSPGRYENRDPILSFYDPLLEKTQAIPGVQAAGLINVMPIQSWGFNREGLHVVGTPIAPREQSQSAELRFVTPGYYAAMSDRLVRGRSFEAGRDTVNTRLVTVVNEEFVKRYIPKDRDPIGMLIGDEGVNQFNPTDENPSATIIGVVKNIRQNIYAPPMPQMDYFIAQMPPRLRLEAVGNMHLVLKTAVKPDAIVPALQRTFRETDPTLPFRAPQIMQAVIADVLIFERLENWLFGIFAGLAILLSVVGLYGLISHEVEMSMRDIGVRLALGASRSRILGGIYRRVGIMLAGGVCAGLALTTAAQKYISSVVAIEAGRDALRIIELTAALVAIGLLAATLPARRASSVEPMEALRDE